MKENLSRTAMVLLLVFLLTCLGVALFAAHAAPLQDTGLNEPAAAAQDCYTLDTSRPEWLAEGPSAATYLPVIVKNWP